MQLRKFLIVFAAVGISTIIVTTAHAGSYVDSAHGDTTNGVARSDLIAPGVDYVKGNCAHCHEQHASVDGAEPNPAGGAEEYLLFDVDNDGQATNFCFGCHTNVGGYQAPSVLNRSYSYRAGGWVADPLNNIKSAFAQSSAHDLVDIVAFADAQSWKYTLKSNACAVCHDPHVVKGDPLGDTNSGKSGARTGVITRVNTSPPNPWGDGLQADLVTIEADKMAGNYLAPNCVSAGSEPECNGTSDGSNLPDYVTFCTDCHDNTTTTFGSKTLTPIDWSSGGSGEIHGQVNPLNTSMLSPYTSGATSYVLSCLDCHEPHGSANLSLIRGAVNGVPITPAITSGVQYDLVCRQCHDPRVSGTTDWDDEHHAGTDPAYAQGSPGSCNSPVGCHIQANAPVTAIDCSNCHYHGAYANDGTVLQTTLGPIDRKTF